METKRLARTAIMLGFILAVVGLMAWSIVAKLTLTPQATAADLRALPLWMIPLHYLWDYAQHGWLCLGFAFIVSGLFQEFIPQDTMIRYMGSGDWRAYVFATVLAPVFCVCSCTMVPIFAGLVYAGSGIGPALTFLLVAPANNLLADIITVQVMGWPIALADMAAGAASAAIATAAVTITIGILRIDVLLTRSVRFGANTPHWTPAGWPWFPVSIKTVPATSFFHRFSSASCKKVLFAAGAPGVAGRP